ncbi:hypothetical protein GCM10017750_67810 [Streptomyces racemochromogenes]|nr:hypothetical protein D1J60_00435 [Streptomyces sp. W1SF4]
MAAAAHPVPAALTVTAPGPGTQVPHFIDIARSGGTTESATQRVRLDTVLGHILPRWCGSERAQWPEPP